MGDSLSFRVICMQICPASTRAEEFSQEETSNHFAKSLIFICGGSLTGPETASASVHDPYGRQNASHTLYLSSNIQSNIEISQRCFCLLGTPYTTLPEKNGEGISSIV